MTTLPPLVMTDERRRKRMISNRESARRSRMKKQQRLEESINEVSRLKSENAQIEMQANLTTEHYFKLEKENSLLRAQMAELTERLRSANMFISVFEEISGVEMDKPEIPDPLLKPWIPAWPVQSYHCYC